MKKVVLKEDQLWDRYEYHLLAEKYNYSVTFVTEGGDFVASFKRPTRASKWLPISEVSAKYTQRFYKAEGLKQPSTLSEMSEVLHERRQNV